ncbi:unnamed protein product [Closterium sp. NIES-54]
MVTTTTPGGQRVSICTCTRTGRHLATFTRRPGSSLYTLIAKPPRIAASAQVSVSGPVAAPCSCRLLSHQTLLRHRRLGHPSLPRLRGMHSRLLVSGLPRSLPPLPPSPAPPCLPYVEGRQRTAPHSSSFPPITAPMQTLQMDVWGPACVSGQGRERYFLLVVDDYTRYTTVFPLCSNGEVPDILIPWIRAAPSLPLPHCPSPPPPLPLFLAPGPPPVDPLPPQGPAPLGVSQVDPLPAIVPFEVAVDSGAAGGAASGGAEPARAEPGDAELAGAEPGGAEFEGAESGGAEPGVRSLGVLSLRVRSLGREPLSPQQLREWFAQRTRLQSGTVEAGGSATGGIGGTRLGVARVTAGVGGTGGAGAAGPGGARTRGTGAAGAGGVGGLGARDPGAGDLGARGTGTGGVGAGGTGVGDPGAGGTSVGGVGVGDSGAGGAGVGGTGAGDPGAGGAGTGGAGASGPGARGTVQQRPSFVPPSPSSLPPPDSVLRQPGSPLPAPSPYPEQTDSPSKRREPASCLASPVRVVRTGRRVPGLRPPPVPGTHVMALPTVVTDPSFESTAVSALVAELVDFAAACRLDYATSLVAESESDCPPSVGDECALGTNVLEDKQEEFECLAAAVPHLVPMLLAPEGDPSAPDIPTPRSYAEAITGPYSSQWQTAMDAELES